jgi:hypothetical protein
VIGINNSYTATVSGIYGGAAGTYTSVLLCTVTDAASNTATCTVNSSITLSQ